MHVSSSQHEYFQLWMMELEKETWLCILVFKGCFKKNVNFLQCVYVPAPCAVIWSHQFQLDSSRGKSVTKKISLFGLLYTSLRKCPIWRFTSAVESLTRSSGASNSTCICRVIILEVWFVQLFCRILYFRIFNFILYFLLNAVVTECFKQCLKCMNIIALHKISNQMTSANKLW